jgi:hypothetical protein
MGTRVRDYEFYVCLNIFINYIIYIYIIYIYILYILYFI